jgi:PAS domain-containing protein
MTGPDSNDRARLILPEGIAPEDFLAGLPDVVSDVLRGTCDVIPGDTTNGDPRVAAALDGLGEGVAVVVERGEIVWMNDRLADHSPEMLRRFADCCHDAIGEFMTHPEVLDGESIRTDFRHGERSYEVICSPMPDDPTRHTVAALVSDVTELKRTEALIEQIDAAGGDLLDLDPDTVNPLDVAARLRLIEDKVVRTMRSVEPDNSSSSWARAWIRSRSANDSSPGPRTTASPAGWRRRARRISAGMRRRIRCIGSAFPVAEAA